MARGQTLVLFPRHHQSWFWRQGLPISTEHTKLWRLASEARDPPVSTPPGLRLQYTTRLGFLHAPGRVRERFHTCTAIILLAEPFPQLHLYFDAPVPTSRNNEVARQPGEEHLVCRADLDMLLSRHSLRFKHDFLSLPPSWFSFYQWALTLVLAKSACWLNML